MICIFFLDPGGFQHTKLKKLWNFKINTLDTSWNQTPTVMLRYCYLHKLHKYVLAQKLFILGWKSPKLTMQTTWLMRFRVTYRYCDDFPKTLYKRSLEFTWNPLTTSKILTPFLCLKRIGQGMVEVVQTWEFSLVWVWGLLRITAALKKHQL